MAQEDACIENTATEFTPSMLTNKIDSLLKMPNCPFVLYIGTRKLAKRVEFEQYIRDIRGKIAIWGRICKENRGVP